MVVETYVRGSSNEAVQRENKKVNRAMAGAALAMGAGVELTDRPGYSAEFHDPDYMKLVQECCEELVGKDKVKFNYESWSTGSSDFGDVTSVMPGVQFNASGATGMGHGIDYYPTDLEKLLINSVKAQILVADRLLKDDAANAKRIIENYKPTYPSMQAYFDDINTLNLDKDAVKYDESGNATLDFQN